uniref:Uncharacterized protein n=1 Tax=Tanacetum cinerariifolium TaxID=118510 RepID=A0A6L2P3Z6_TANCI|nr:hypothetical protein [Tanacetum cinerariifolium]
MEVEPLEETQLEDLGLNTCNHDIPLSSKKVPIFDEQKPQPQPLPNWPYLDASLGNERGPEPPIKPPSSDSFKMKEVDHLTIHTLLSLMKFLIKKEEEIFTDAGDGIKIIPDGVAPLAM